MKNEGNRMKIYLREGTAIANFSLLIFHFLLKNFISLHQNHH